MAQLTGLNSAVPLGGGYEIRAPGVWGSAEIRRPLDIALRSRSRSVDDGAPELDAAFAASGVTETRRIELVLQPPSQVAVAGALRGTADGQRVLELSVPDLGAKARQVVLACDECGVMTWHFPIDDEHKLETPATRGGGGVKRFLIPAVQSKPSASEAAASRSLIGVVGKKLLKVLVYDILDGAVGAVSESLAEKWEEKKRPYGLRSFTPENFRDPDILSSGNIDWQRFVGKRGLLFIHGTFSTAHGAFNQIPDNVFAELYRRYEGRVIAFNHFTLSHSPIDNINWLLSMLPGDPLEFDVICHSRGGLVARTLAERPSGFQLGQRQVSIPRMVCVGVPNNGTLLANPDHMVAMLDRITTVLNMFPSGAVVETLEAVLTVVKIIGHGALGGLNGLASMNPDGDFLAKMNQGAASNTSYYAIAADYEPASDGMKALIAGSIADAVADRVFHDTANDLVVPLAGAFGANGHSSFPIPDAHVLQIPKREGVIHTQLFSHPETGKKLLEWLAQS